MDIDAPTLFFDGTLDKAATYGGETVRAIVEETIAPADGGGLQRAPGNWAMITLQKSEVATRPEIQAQITDADGQVWRVQQAQDEGDVWFLLCVSDRRMHR